MRITQIAAAMFDLGRMDYDIASIIYDTMTTEIAVAQGENQPAVMIPHNLPDSPESPFVDITPIVQATPAYATLLQNGLISRKFHNLKILCQFRFRIIEPKDPTKRGCRGASYNFRGLSEEVMKNRITVVFSKGASLMPKTRIIEIIRAHINHELQHMFQYIVKIYGGRQQGRSQEMSNIRKKDMLQYGPEDRKIHFESPNEIQANAAGLAVYFFQWALHSLHDGYEKNPTLTTEQTFTSEQMANELRTLLNKKLPVFLIRNVPPNISPESKQEFIKALVRNVQKLIDQYAEGQHSLTSQDTPAWTTVRTNPKNRWDGLNVKPIKPQEGSDGKAASTHTPIKIAEPIQVAVEKLHSQGLSPADIAAELLRRGRYVSEKGVILILKTKLNPDNPEPKAASTNFDIIVRG
jgi:hypothetical protein